MTDKSRTLAGIACGMVAGAMWGLVFLAPELARDFSPLQLAVGRYLSYGLLAAALLAPRWGALVGGLGRAEWLALAWLSLLGNTLYYVLLASAVQLGGIAMTSLVIGFLPVAVTIIGSRERGAIPLGRLVPSLLLSAAGVLCIGWQSLGDGEAGSVVGLLCAIGALTSWTGYAVGNSRWLARVGHISAHDWSLLTGVMTGAQALLLVAPALLLDSATHSLSQWGYFALICAGIGLLASIVGNAAWNQMSRLIPMTLAGQMILFETLFALLYGFLWEARLPTVLEGMALVLVLTSVVSCLAAHSSRVAPAH